MADLTNRKPCGGCPYARHVTPGATGGSHPSVYVGQAVGPFWLPCHEAPEYKQNKLAPNNVDVIPQCAGAAIYRANVGAADALPPSFLKAAPDAELVFGTHAELLAHHLQIPLADAEAILVDKPPGVMLWDELTKIQRSHMRLIPKDRRPK